MFDLFHRARRRAYPDRFSVPVTGETLNALLDGAMGAIDRFRAALEGLGSSGGVGEETLSSLRERLSEAETGCARLTRQHLPMWQRYSRGAGFRPWETADGNDSRAGDVRRACEAMSRLTECMGALDRETAGLVHERGARRQRSAAACGKALQDMARCCEVLMGALPGVYDEPDAHSLDGSRTVYEGPGFFRR